MSKVLSVSRAASAVTVEYEDGVSVQNCSTEESAADYEREVASTIEPEVVEPVVQADNVVIADAPVTAAVTQPVAGDGAGDAIVTNDGGVQ